MRWGVREEATDDHTTLELCLKELKACQEISTGPNFVVSTVVLLCLKEVKACKEISTGPNFVASSVL